MPPAIPLLVAGAGMMAEGATVMGVLGAMGGGSALLGGVVLAGSALSTIGTLTGSQSLVKIGGIVGMVGGVGALANGAGLLGNIAQQASTTGMNASSVAGGGNNLSAFTNPAADAAPSMGSAAATGDTVSQVADAGKSLNGDPYAPDPSAANGGVISGNSSQVAAATKSPVQPLVGGGASNVSPTDTTNMPSGIPGSSISVGIGGSISKVGQFIKDNKELVNVAGGLVGGAMNDVAKQKQQQRQYELEEQAKLAARKRYNDSMVGTKAPVYVPPPLASAKG